MADLLSIENFKGMVTDVSDGKQPAGTCKEIKNLVYDREYGSLVTRFTYENSLARPTGVATLSHWLTYPTTYPSAQDNHIWFTEDGIFVRPYFHNSSTATDDWKLITESFALTSISSGDVTVNASPTNTVVIVGADAYGLSSTNDYYNNWMWNPGSGSTQKFVRDYAYSAAAAGTATFTLDNVLSLTANAITDTPGYNMHRYFHKDASFTPAFTSPAGYSTETAYRWSGGAGSTVGYKNIWAGYLSKTFFEADATNKYTFTGSYIEQAECFAPASTISQAITVANAITTSLVITNTNDYQFNGSSTNWAANGNHSATLINMSGVNRRALSVASTGTGDETNNRVALASVSLSQSTNYKLRLQYSSNINNAFTNASNFKIMWNGNTISTFAVGGGFVKEEGDLITWEPIEVDFTIPTTGTGNLSIFFTDGAPPYPVNVEWINIYQTTNDASGLLGGNTYSFYASYLYDSSQESELTYLGRTYVSTKQVKIQNVLQLGLGSLNKRITAVRLYVAIDKGDTTKASNVERINPAYLFRTVTIDDSTYSWALDATNGLFEYTDNFTAIDEDGLRFTWEQKTNRTASTSQTCSYKISAKVGGRILVANDYDYADAAEYTNRIRFTGFNGDGAPTPDIFPNLPDIAITTITMGDSQQINNIAEFDGDIVILKKSSILRLDTSNPDSLTWRLTLIKNGVGTQGKRTALKFDKGLFFTDLYSAYLYDGYQVRDVLKGRWRNLYQSLVTTAAKAASQRVWHSSVNDTIAVAYDTVTSSSDRRKFYEFNTDSWLPVLSRQAENYEVANLVTTSDGVTHFAPSAVGANAFKFSTVVGTPLVDVSIDTGYYDVQKGMVGYPKWVYMLAESGTASSFTVNLYSDGSLIQTGTFTPSAASKILYKFQVLQDRPSKMLKITFAQTGTVAPSTQQFKLHKLWVEGDLVPERTDVSETVVIT